MSTCVKIQNFILMVIEQAIPDIIIASLENKLKELGYNPQPEQGSSDLKQFSSAQGKSLGVILRLLNWIKHVV